MISVTRSQNETRTQPLTISSTLSVQVGFNPYYSKISYLCDLMNSLFFYDNFSDSCFDIFSDNFLDKVVIQQNPKIVIPSSTAHESPTNIRNSAVTIDAETHSQQQTRPVQQYKRASLIYLFSMTSLFGAKSNVEFCPKN